MSLVTISYKPIGACALGLASPGAAEPRAGKALVTIRYKPLRRPRVGALRWHELVGGGGSSRSSGKNWSGGGSNSSGKNWSGGGNSPSGEGRLGTAGWDRWR
jgi:hypothetical protein